MRHQKITLLAIASCISCATLASCDPAFDAMAERERVGLTRMTHYFAPPSGGAEIRTAVLSDVSKAQTRVWAALSNLSDEGVATALATVAGEGVLVEVVTDESQRPPDDGPDSPSVAILKAAGIEITYGDGQIAYLPEPTITSVLQDCEVDPDDGLFIQCIRRADQSTVLPNDGLMVRPDDYNVMTHNFFVIDDVTVWNLATPLGASNTPWFAWRAHSQEMVQAFEREFRQMSGGTFSTTLTAFNGPNKSENHGPVYDSRLPSDRPGRNLQLQPGFMTEGGMMDVLFNPQSRLVKELIDEIYGARASVFLMSDQITNEFVIDALVYKARFFDVKVIVREGSVIPDALRDLRDAQNDLVLRTVPYSYAPTVLLTDAGDDSSARSGMVLTHPTFHSAPFQVFNPGEPGFERVRTDDDIVRIYPSDLFVDGSLWLFREYNQNNKVPTIDRLAGFVDGELWTNATEVQ